jgi:hypothetical protein
MLNAIAKTGADDSIEKAKEVFALMEELHRTGVDVAPTTGTYNCLLNVWKAFRDRPDAATESLAILKQMKSQPGWAMPNRKTYNTVLYTLTPPKGAHIDLAEDLIQEMNNSDDPALRPDSITYNTILNFLGNQKLRFSTNESRRDFLIDDGTQKGGGSRCRADDRDIQYHDEGRRKHPNVGRGWSGGSTSGRVGNPLHKSRSPVET